MFSLSRSESQRRRARSHAVNKRAASSRVSLISNLTSQSMRSAGSASTITQDSYSRSERRIKRRLSKTAKSKSTRNTSSIMQADKRPRKSRQNSESDVDVFSYLVKDIADPSGTSTSWETERSRISKRASVQADSDEVETKSIRSRLSDSGISMNDSGYDSASPSSYLKPRLGSLPENVLVEGYERLQQQNHQHHQQAPLQMHPSLPQSHTQAHYHYPDPCWPPAPAQQPRLLSEEPYRSDVSCIRPPPSGYDLLASNLSHVQNSAPVLPSLYRRFTALNHRILLQLQDEISEMETELNRLDDTDAHYRREQPASRRTDWGSARLDLLGKISVKIERYHAAVLSMQKVKSATTAATMEDIGVYLDWLAKHKPLQDVEMRFLDNEGDVMSLDAPSSLSPATTAALVVYDFYLLSSLAGVWLITCVPSIVSRWTFLILLAGFTITTQPSTLPTFDFKEAWSRLKAIMLPLTFWMLVTTIC